VKSEALGLQHLPQFPSGQKMMEQKQIEIRQYSVLVPVQTAMEMEQKMYINISLSIQVRQIII